MDLPGEGLRGGRIGHADQQDPELVAAEPDRRVGEPDRRLQARADLADDLVARAVAVRRR